MFKAWKWSALTLAFQMVVGGAAYLGSGGILDSGIVASIAFSLVFFVLMVAVPRHDESEASFVAALWGLFFAAGPPGVVKLIEAVFRIDVNEIVWWSFLGVVFLVSMGFWLVVGTCVLIQEAREDGSIAPSWAIAIAPVSVVGVIIGGATLIFFRIRDWRRMRKNPPPLPPSSQEEAIAAIEHICGIKSSSDDRS